MFQEIMEDVKNAEQKAAETVENAKLQALRLVEDAKKQAEKHVEEEWRKQKLRAEDALLFAKTKGDEYASGIALETENQLADLKKKVSEKEGEAVRLVMEHLI